MGATALTIGNFDGVHEGHAALIERARKRVGPEGRIVVLAFDPHPTRLLRPDNEPPKLTTFARRSELLRVAGADEVRRLAPDAALLGLSPSEFIRYAVDSFSPKVFVEGPDFRFGKNQAGRIRELRSLGESHGFDVEVVDPVEVDLLDQSVVRASSSLTRWLLAKGRVADAARVLGRPHEVSGVVGHGDRRGRAIGFPTANVSPEQMLPGAGVYACKAVLPNGRTLDAAVHVGERPTFEDGDPRVEAHLLGLPTSFGGESGTDATDRAARPAGAWAPIEGLEETGWSLTLRFVRWLRDPVRFGSIDELKAQLARDCARVSLEKGTAGHGAGETPQEIRA